MMSSFKIHIITPDESFADKEITFANFQAVSGRVSVLPRHQPMLCALREGETVFHIPGGTEQRWSTGKGFLKVDRNEVLLLTHYAELKP